MGGAAALLSQPAKGETFREYSAAAFVDSVGINTHLSSEPYATNFGRVCELLSTSGVLHLRDELRPNNNLDRWREIYARYRIRSHLLVSPATNTIAQMLDYIAALGVEKISAIEGQNEGDSEWFKAQRAAHGDWSAAAVTYQREVFQALRPRYSAAALPIVSPTVLDWKPGDMTLLRDAADFCDIVAIHSYLQHGEEPETRSDYAAVSWYLRNMRDSFKPGAAVMATETGYNNMVRPGGSGMSETAAGIYTCRLLLNNFASGVQRTYVYELMDGGLDPNEPEHHWGLVRNDGTPKPAFQAIARLLGALGEEESSARPQTHPAGAKFREPQSEARLLQFRKLDGSAVVAIWRAVSCWDVESAVDLAVSPKPVAVDLDGSIAKAEFMVPNDSAAWAELPIRDGGIVVPVSGKVVLVRLSGMPG